MNNPVEAVVLVEGTTEKIFIEKMVAPHLVLFGIYLTPIVISKPGQKGGDVRFSRVKNDIELHLKQRADTYLTLMESFRNAVRLKKLMILPKRPHPSDWRRSHHDLRKPQPASLLLNRLVSPEYGNNVQFSIGGCYPWNNLDIDNLIHDVW